MGSSDLDAVLEEIADTLDTLAVHAYDTDTLFSKYLAVRKAYHELSVAILDSHAATATYETAVHSQESAEKVSELRVIARRKELIIFDLIKKELP